ncbi:efflux RND transporter periplasmic adaptor subunit [Desulfoplanes formicivorans]|uniref:RND transporter n=1 Tax=Desulfoplanes formicivorans TaxID=1592317 RepID=A0A194AEB4_9BACT|nr:efflux RND transporter periplasmic adaptor subunit [Desulfoplanes formicivorans]GAU07668.1 RND transporter [Desulfoplanes formicivorans]
MTESNSIRRQWCRKIFGFLLPVVIVVLGALGAKYFLDSRPKPTKKARITLAPLVTVQKAAFGKEQVVIQAMGTVVPARETVLSPQVAGRIVHLARGFEPGGILAQGTRVAGIDPKDFELNVQQKQMALVQAKAALALEQGQQAVARKEWELLRGNRNMSSEEATLALRKPQLEQAQADVTKARLDLQQAELDLARTSVVAPFNCLVLEKNVDLGAQVSTQTTIATLVGTDAYWVETSIPRDRLSWIKVPKGAAGTGSTARIRSAVTDNARTGQVIRLLGDIESQGRMARVLVRVDDPLFLKENDPSQVPLLLGEYVHVDILGRVLEHVVAIPRDALRDGNTIWIATRKNTLDIRSVEIVWRDAHVVYLAGGVQDGEQIILSDIAAPVQGMEVRIADEVSGAATGTIKGSAKNS